MAKNLAQPNPQAMINLTLLVTHQSPTGRLLRKCRGWNGKNPGAAASMQDLQAINVGSRKIMNGNGAGPSEHSGSSENTTVVPASRLSLTTQTALGVLSELSFLEPLSSEVFPPL